MKTHGSEKTCYSAQVTRQFRNLWARSCCSRHPSSNHLCLGRCPFQERIDSDNRDIQCCLHNSYAKKVEAAGVKAGSDALLSLQSLRILHVLASSTAAPWRKSRKGVLVADLLSTRIEDVGIAIRHLRGRILFYNAGSRNGLKGVGTGGR